MKQKIPRDISGEGGKLCKKVLVIDDEPELEGEKMAISDQGAVIPFNTPPFGYHIKGGNVL